MDVGLTREPEQFGQEGLQGSTVQLVQSIHNEKDTVIASKDRLENLGYFRGRRPRASLVVFGIEAPHRIWEFSQFLR